MLHLTVGETSRKEEKIGAFFSIEESKLHIDALEIKAVIFGLGKLSYLIQVGNILVVAAINKMGSTRSSIWTEKYTGYGIGLVQKITG